MAPLGTRTRRRRLPAREIELLVGDAVQALRANPSELTRLARGAELSEGRVCDLLEGRAPMDGGLAAKLGSHLGKTTISRYLSKIGPAKDPQQRWTTFLKNHRDVIAGMDCFVVPTLHFRLLYAWFAIDHGRRRLLHFNVTAHPTANRVMPQLRDAFPDVPSHRYLIFDHDSIFSPELVKSIPSFGIHPKKTALQSPWQNGTAEHFVGSVRRELLDYVVVLHEDHLRRLLRECIEYYNTERVHTSISAAPEGRAVDERPSDQAKVVGLPRVGGLHHRYVWAEAA